MKLLRFALKSEPERIRSGIVQGGRIYETENGEGIGMHEPADVQPLIPVANCRSVRLFWRDLQPDTLVGYDGGEPEFSYANANSLIGPSQIIAPATLGEAHTVRPFLAAIVLGDAYRVAPDEADELILGLTILSVFGELSAVRKNVTLGRSSDAAMAIGPVVTTPEELEDFVIDEEFGRRYKLEAIVRVNGVERARGNCETLPITLAQAISAASQTTPLRESDIIAIGPIAEGEFAIEEEDEIQVVLEHMGAIATAIAPLT